MNLSTLSLWFVGLVLSSVISVNGSGFPLRGQLATGDHLDDLHLLGPSVRVHLNRVPIQQTSISTSASSDQSTSPPDQQDDSDSSSSSSSSSSSTSSSSTIPKEPIPSLPSWNSTQHSFSTLIKRDGSFLFPKLQPGTYLLTLASRTHSFHQYRIDVPILGEMTGWGQHKKQKPVTARVWLPGQPASTSLLSNPLSSPLIITANSKHEFFTEPEGFNPKVLLANPMILMAGAAMLLTYVMPKIMASMDPETAKEMEENQRNMQRKMNALQSGDLGGFLNQAAEGRKAEGKRIKQK